MTTIISVLQQIERDREWLTNSPVLAEIRRIARQNQPNQQMTTIQLERWERITESVERIEKLSRGK